MSTSVFFHHAEIGSTSCNLDDYDRTVIHADITNRDGGSVHLFFDCVDDVERMAEELKWLAEGLRAKEPKDVCAETGEVLV